MAIVNIIFASAGPDAHHSIIPVYNGRFTAAQTINSSATSQATSITAHDRDAVRVTVSGGAIWVGEPSDDPEALVDECWLLLDGGTLDLGGLQLGDKIAIIDADVGGE